jgi:hypothetical protein
MAGQYDMERRRPTCVGTVPTKKNPAEAGFFLTDSPRFDYC